MFSKPDKVSHSSSFSWVKLLFMSLVIFSLSGCVVEEELNEDVEGGNQEAGGEVIRLDMDPDTLEDCSDFELCQEGFEMDPQTCECLPGPDCADIVECPADLLLDPETCECLRARECPDIAECPPGSELDPETCECVEVGCDCPAVEDPVCGEDEVTYASACQAECDGVEVDYPGPCESIPLCFEEDVEPECESLCMTFEVCINQYCGTMEEMRSECIAGCNQNPQEFLGALWPNLCVGTDSCESFIEQGIMMFGDGVCNDVSGECVEPNPDVDYVADDPDECELIDFGCPDNAEYYHDECGCGCYIRDCDQECERVEEDPVCTPDGRTFPSECHAFCSGAREHRPCTTECVCPEVYEPQCGLDGFTYNNSCIRECQGVPLLSEGECGNDRDLCEALDTEDDLSCEQVCNSVNACFIEQCTEDELSELNETCQMVCGQTSPYFFCEFGSCRDLGFLISDFSETRLSCASIECPDEGRGAQYVAYDSETCSLIGEINCESGESFSNQCGCGCMNDQCPSEDQARYISYEPEVCAVITLSCPEESEAFNDDCGCGCRF